MVHLSESPDDPIAVARPPTSSRHEAAQTQKSWVSEHESQPQSFVEDAPQLVVDPGTVIGKRKLVVCEQREREDGLHGEGCMKRAKVDLSTKQSVQLLRGGPDYTEVAVLKDLQKQLHEDFSYLEEQCIRTLFESLSSFYALTHLFLLNKQNEVLKRLNLKVVPPCPNLTKRNKGKGRALEDAEFDKERQWLLEVLANHERINNLIDAGDVDGSSQDKLDSDDGRMVECGCCFSECPARPPGRRGTRKSNGKCLLFDAEVDKHNDEVIQAAAVALEQVKQELPDVEQNVLRVEPPPAPRQIASPQRIRPILRPLFRPLPLVGGQLIPPPAPYMLGEQLPPAHILARMRNHLFAAPLMHDNAFPLPNELAGHRFDQLNINPVFVQARAMQAPLNLPGVPPLNHPMPVPNPPNLNMLPVPYLPLAQLPVQIGVPPMNLAAPHIPRAAAHAHEVVNPAQNLLHPVPPLVVPHQFVPPAVLPFSQHHLHCPRLFRDQGHQRQGGFLPYPLMAPPMQPQMPLPLSPQNGPGQDLQDFLPQAVQNHPILG
ncbi:hypothetical protein H0H93_002174 [Arthromyces matolae]|nr:hypothetical protein H0H93_002174 [Arthromyces matolae]